jgi:phage tail sheath gpL-like
LAKSCVKLNFPMRVSRVSPACAKAMFGSDIAKSISAAMAEGINIDLIVLSLSFGFLEIIQ